MAWVGCRVRSERGATIALAAVSMVAMLSVMALAVDLGVLFKAHNDAQRAADAAALAGASAFFDNPDPASAVAPARARARAYAAQNAVLGQAVDPANEVDVDVDQADRKVRVVVHRDGIGTSFAGMFGVNVASVSAAAAARVAEANTTTNCVRPSAIPDMWNEADQDPDGDRVWDWADPDRERWVYEDGTGDAYERALHGYGSNFRGQDLDRGRQAILVDGNPPDATPSTFYQAWGFESSDNDPVKIAGRITGCDSRAVELGTQLLALNGGGAEVADAWDDLANDDPNLSWDDNTNTVVGTSNYGGGDWTKSPRVIVVVLFDPRDVGSGGNSNFHVANLARFFLEERACTGCPVTGRFLGYVSGSDPGPPGSLVQRLQLIE